MRYIIDRFEENFAICEDGAGNRVEIEKRYLPAGAKEGSALEVDGGAIVLVEDTLREQRIAEKMDSVWR